jgi:hypothetical protein
MPDSRPLRFGSAPGPRERHLRRRAGNVLFPAARRDVTQPEVDLARSADEREAHQFREDFLELVKDAVDLPAHAESEDVLALRERIGALYDSGAGLGGDHVQELKSLEKLYQTITGAVRANAGGDALALAELDQEREARALHLDLIRHPLVCDLLRRDSPIAADELVPTLLSAEAHAVRAAMVLFDPAQRRELHAAARDLLDVLPAGGGEPAGCRQRLTILLEAARAGEGVH